MKKYIVFFLAFLTVNINLVYARETVKYVGCIDGDTIKVLVKNKEATVRLLAVDTPEVEKPDKPGDYYGKEASEYTCTRIKKAKKIELEYDSNSDKYDKYDRLLAWVFLDGKLLQNDLVRLGYAKVAYLYGDYKYADMLKEKQEMASAKALGIWGNENKQEEPSNDDQIYEEYTNKEVIIVVVLFLIVVFISDKIFRKKK